MDLPLRMSADELTAFLDEAFPSGARAAYGDIVAVASGHVRIRLVPTAAMLRPGNLVAGPVQMGMADVAGYAVVLAHIGPVAMAVTNTLTMNFLRGCRFEPVIADARLLKLGRRLALVDVRLWQEDERKLTAQGTVGYALP